MIICFILRCAYLLYFILAGSHPSLSCSSIHHHLILHHIFSFISFPLALCSSANLAAPFRANQLGFYGNPAPFETFWRATVRRAADFMRHSQCLTPPHLETVCLWGGVWDVGKELLDPVCENGTGQGRSRLHVCDLGPVHLEELKPHTGGLVLLAHEIQI